MCKSVELLLTWSLFQCCYVVARLFWLVTRALLGGGCVIWAGCYGVLSGYLLAQDSLKTWLGLSLSVAMLFLVFWLVTRAFLWYFKWSLTDPSLFISTYDSGCPSLWVYGIFCPLYPPEKHLIRLNRKVLAQLSCLFWGRDKYASENVNI